MDKVVAHSKRITEGNTDKLNDSITFMLGVVYDNIYAPGISSESNKEGSNKYQEERDYHVGGVS